MAQLAAKRRIKSFYQQRYSICKLKKLIQCCLQFISVRLSSFRSLDNSMHITMFRTHLILQTANRHTILLINIKTDRIAGRVIQVSAPCISSTSLRSQPPPTGDPNAAEHPGIVTVTTRKSRKTTLIGCACIGICPMCCTGFSSAVVFLLIF